MRGTASSFCCVLNNIHDFMCHHIVLVRALSLYCVLNNIRVSSYCFERNYYVLLFDKICKHEKCNICKLIALIVIISTIPSIPFYMTLIPFWDISKIMNLLYLLFLNTTYHYYTHYFSILYSFILNKHYYTHYLPSLSQIYY